MGVRGEPTGDHHQLAASQDPTGAQDDDDPRQRWHDPLHRRPPRRDLRRPPEVRVQAGSHQRWQMVQRR